MFDECPKLVDPTEALSEAYLEFLAEFRAVGEPLPFDDAGVTIENFMDFVQRLQAEARGEGLPEGWVPATTYWLVCRERVLGTCNIRHTLTEALRDYGGHVGYYVRPSDRRKGYGTLMLRLAIARARELGIDRLLVTCSKGNEASIHVIENNGGRLKSQSYSPQAGRITRRYWIDIEP